MVLYVICKVAVGGVQQHPYLNTENHTKHFFSVGHIEMGYLGVFRGHFEGLWADLFKEGVEQ